MTRLPRKAIPAADKGAHVSAGAALVQTNAPSEAPGEIEAVSKRLYVPICKVNGDAQTITGIVLQPEVVDAQGDIMSTNVIQDAAHKFLAGYNAGTKLGLMHKDFKERFELFESYVAPVDLVVGDRQIKAGSWVIVVHILDKKIWDQVKSGKLNGFSIGGKAKVNKLSHQGA